MNAMQSLPDEGHKDRDRSCDLENAGKLQYELPANYEYEVHECICYRSQKVYECGCCHHYFHGRISERCRVHPTDAFLMDFRCCPYCSTPTANIQVSVLTWAAIRQMEDARFPDEDNDDDL